MDYTGFAVSGLRAIGGAVITAAWGGGSPSSSPNGATVPYDYEPLGGVLLTLAIGGLYGDAIKPIYINHHNRWHDTSPRQNNRSIIINTQSIERTVKNISDNSVGTRKVIPLWNHAIKCALAWNAAIVQGKLPTKANAPPITEKTLKLVRQGLENTRKAYACEDDPATTKWLDSCLETLECKKYEDIEESSILNVHKRWGSYISEIALLERYLHDARKLIKKNRLSTYDCPVSKKLDICYAIIDERCTEYDSPSEEQIQAIVEKKPNVI